MKWKSNKTQPTIEDNQDVIVIIDILGHIYFNLKLDGVGKKTKISGKEWKDIKEDVAFWQYSNIIENLLKRKLHFENPSNNTAKTELLSNLGVFK